LNMRRVKPRICLMITGTIDSHLLLSRTADAGASAVPFYSEYWEKSTKFCALS
jgi:hypothetical protein